MEIIFGAVATLVCILFSVPQPNYYWTKIPSNSMNAMKVDIKSSQKILPSKSYLLLFAKKCLDCQSAKKYTGGTKMLGAPFFSQEKSNF